MLLKTSIGVLAISLLLSACGKQAPEHEPASPTAQTQAASAPATAASVRPATDAWIGRWIGPEGTFLDIAGESGTYRVTVQNLDGPRTFDATASGAAIRFTRDGVDEAIRAGSGADTGMKWLMDKKDCLVVKAGEGYCRG